jgi:Domain of unknown function (DUF4375)
MNKNDILINLSESKNTSFGKEDFALQSLPQKVFSAIWAVESEVNNGGFSQYFSNNSAESASFVAQALEIVGAPRTANICNRAIATAFPGGLPTTVEAIRSVADKFSEETLAELEPLDQEFFSYPHNLTDLLFTYVSARPDEFGALAKPR